MPDIAVFYLKGENGEYKLTLAHHGCYTIFRIKHPREVMGTPKIFLNSGNIPNCPIHNGERTMAI
ncbi:MAG: hypothetical protein HY220_03365 [Candidatus Sungbacteria bacterium]|uniref:Uncharacterized protein n=1 Tax=Candidatus Sungiibacteriota bacterium TaxID=2750080 RepID=A0A9D6LS26_9BACT|nr:hypothetical protein [Candidatus Sungbacteria bacterium]